MARASMTAVRSSEGFTVEAHVPGRYVGATAGNLIAFYWIADADLEGARFLHRVCEKQTQGRTRIASAIHIVHPRVSLPSAEVRSQLVASMEAFSEVTCGIGVVLLGTGFWASAMRSALTGIRMVIRTGASQMRFGQSPGEIIAWLASTHESATDEPLGTADPHVVVQQVCALAGG